MKKETCKNCIHFKNAQRELNYWNNTGFCVNPKFAFNTVDGRLIGVYDRGNMNDITKITGNPSHDIETVKCGAIRHSRYSLQVEEDFGCIYIEQK